MLRSVNTLMQKANDVILSHKDDDDEFYGA